MWFYYDEVHFLHFGVLVPTKAPESRSALGKGQNSRSSKNPQHNPTAFRAFSVQGV